MDMNNKGSDKNVANIEDDIEILESIVKVHNDFLQGVNKESINEKEIRALERVLLHYKNMKFNYENLIHDISLIAESLDMQEDSTIEEIAIRISEEMYNQQQKDKRIQELEEELAKYKDIDYMFKIDSNENRVDMKKIYFEWLEYKNKIQKLEEESEILEFQNKQVENYAEELKKYNKTVSDRIVEYKKNSIQKQVVVDVINENGFEVYTREYGNVEVVSIDVLQELLEGEVGRRLGE